MHLTAGLATAVCLPIIWAFPSTDVGSVNDHTTSNSLVARVGLNDGSSYENARDVRLDATGWENVANDMAWAMLCAKPPAPRTFQRLEEEDDKERKNKKSQHYRASGAANRPAKPDRIHKYNLRKPRIDPKQEGWATMEEIPGESANVLNEETRRVILFPSPLSEQKRQGQKLTETFRKYKVENGQWYRYVGIDNCDRTYCKAFNDDDYSVCHKKLKGNEIDPDEIAAVRISNPGQPYAYINIGLKDWGGPTPKRDGKDEGIDTLPGPGSDTQDSRVKRGWLDEEYPESELVSDNLPAIDQD